MDAKQMIYILGAGAVGFPLAAYLTEAGRHVVAVRTSKSDVPRGAITVGVQNGADHVSAQVEAISLSALERVEKETAKQVSRLF